MTDRTRVLSWHVRRAIAPFAIFGTVCVVAGGLVAAVTAPAASEVGSWSAAYLVLVAGVAQIALGAGQAFLPVSPPSRTVIWLEFIVLNLANAGVIAGTLTGIPLMVSAGGILLFVALALFFWGVRGFRGVRGPADAHRSRVLYAYRIVIVVVAVSIPVGVVLSYLKSS